MEWDFEFDCVTLIVNCGFKREKMLQSKQMVSIYSDAAELLINVENTALWDE